MYGRTPIAYIIQDKNSIMARVYDGLTKKCNIKLQGVCPVRHLTMSFSSGWVKNVAYAPW